MAFRFPAGNTPLPFQNPACVFCRSFTGLQNFAPAVFQQGASRSRVSSAGGLFPPVYFFYHFLSGKKTRTYKKETPESRMNRAFQRVSSLLSDANNYFTSDNMCYVKCHYFIISFYLSHTANPCPVCVCDTFNQPNNDIIFFYYTVIVLCWQALFYYSLPCASGLFVIPQ